YLSALSPAVSARNRTMTAAITGVNLSGASMVTITGSGVTASIGAGGTATSVPITFTIAADASIGGHDITLLTPGGFSNTVTLQVVDVPTITAVTPAIGVAGTSVNVTVTGTNLLGATFAFSGSGVTASI